MLPAVKPGEWVLCQGVRSLDDIKNGGIYIFVETDSLRLKKARKNPDRESCTLISLNAEYPPDELPYASIREVWEYHSKISFDLDQSPQNGILQEIRDEIAEIRRGLEK